MKKSLILSVGIASLFSFSAQAADFKPYVGLDLANTYFDIKKHYDYAEKSYASFNLNVGTRIYDSPAHKFKYP
ncbi:MAG: hypothetical protein PHE89_04740 [Alphaproteobacteria bacterium]|nr:hypothetical protein [Alphaproteobacteria bacterium]